MPLPQDDTIPKEVVERVARVAVDDLHWLAEKSHPSAFIGDLKGMEVYIDGHVHMGRLIRVIAAALKETSHG